MKKKVESKTSPFKQFVSDVDARFLSLEKLLKKGEEPDPALTDTGDFKLLKENYDKKFDEFSTELTSLKELFTGVKDKVTNSRLDPDSSFASLFLGF